MIPEEPEIVEDPNCPPGTMYLINPAWMTRVPLPENWLDDWAEPEEELEQ